MGAKEPASAFLARNPSRRGAASFCVRRQESTSGRRDSIVPPFSAFRISAWSRSIEKAGIGGGATGIFAGSGAGGGEVFAGGAAGFAGGGRAFAGGGGFSGRPPPPRQRGDRRGGPKIVILA